MYIKCSQKFGIVFGFYPCFLVIRVFSRVLTLGIPASLGAGSGKQICLGEYVRSAHFEPPTRNVSPGRLQARANQFTSILYGTPEKTLLFPPNRTKLRFIDLSAQPPPLNECVSGNGGRLEGKPGSV